MSELYDVVIIGSGPAGLTAGLYCAQAGLSVLMLEQQTMGGKMVDIETIENYPGFSEGVAGAELGSQMMLQASKYGAQIQLEKVEGLEVRTGNHRVRTESGGYFGKTVIIAGGARPKKLGVPGEEEFFQKGVGYCAMCDGGQFAGKAVVVGGGGDAGLTDALYMSKLASKVIVVEVMPRLNALNLLQDRASKDPKIEIKCGTRIEAILGDNEVNAVKLLNTNTKEVTTLPTAGILVRIGIVPETDYLKGIVPLDNGGQIMVDECMRTAVPGIFAAGDIRHDSPRQVATAVGDGTTAAISAQRYLRESAG